MKGDIKLLSLKNGEVLMKIEGILAISVLDGCIRIRGVIESTLESGIDLGQGINVGPGKFVKKNKCRA